jgi:hypothetical protein
VCACCGVWACGRRFHRLMITLLFHSQAAGRLLLGS